MTILVFSLMHLIPGDPAQIIAGEGASEETVEQIRERLGLNKPVHVQYFHYISNAVQGDLGNSIRSGRAVMDEIQSRFWVTVELAFYATVLAVFIGMIAGIISAVRHYTWSDVSIMIVALFGLVDAELLDGTSPYPMVCSRCRLAAASGIFENETFWLGRDWRQIILPVITLGTGGAAIIARMTRSSMLEVIGQDYIRTARAKGLSERIVIYQTCVEKCIDSGHYSCWT